MTPLARQDNLNISNEAQLAMKKLFECWANNEIDVYDAIIVNETQIQQDNYGFSTQPIVLEKGVNWRWNKTSVLKNLNLSPGTSVTLCKMQSRAKSPGAKTPSFKVWLYSIDRSNSQHPVYFFWVARGWSLPQVEELSFLSEFVSENIAKELNWLS